MGCSVVLVTLNLFDKVSRYNEWELAAGIVLADRGRGVRSSQPWGAEGIPAARELITVSQRTSTLMRIVASSSDVAISPERDFDRAQIVTVTAP